MRAVARVAPARHLSPRPDALAPARRQPLLLPGGVAARRRGGGSIRHPSGAVRLSVCPTYRRGALDDPLAVVVSGVETEPLAGALAGAELLESLLL